MALNFPSGTQSGPASIIQIQYYTMNAVWTSTANGWKATGLSDSITPSSTSSKILVQVHLGAASADDNTIAFRLFRNGSELTGANGTQVNNNLGVWHREGGNFKGDYNHARGAFMHYVDSPSTTSSLTYQLYMNQETESGTVHINREINSGNTTGIEQTRTSSTIVLMEISG